MHPPPSPSAEKMRLWPNGNKIYSETGLRRNRNQRVLKRKAVRSKKANCRHRTTWLDGLFSLQPLGSKAAELQASRELVNGVGSVSSSCHSSLRRPFRPLLQSLFQAIPSLTHPVPSTHEHVHTSLKHDVGNLLCSTTFYFGRNFS